MKYQLNLCSKGLSYHLEGEILWFHVTFSTSKCANVNLPHHTKTQKNHYNIWSAIIYEPIIKNPIFYFILSIVAFKKSNQNNR